MRDTGMRNERELYRMRIENLDWNSRVIFVPDSHGRRTETRTNEQSLLSTFSKHDVAQGAKVGFSCSSAQSLLTLP
jgi:hypothetical protein